MTPAKWLQLLAYLLAWAGYLNFLADRKWDDEKRTAKNRQLFRFARFLYTIGILALGIGLIFNFAQKDKSPDFLIYANGLMLTNEVYITVPTTNGSVTLEYWVLNRGTAEAENFMLSAYFPHALEVVSSGNWRLGGWAKNSENSGLTFISDKVYSIIQDDDRIMRVNGFSVFPQITVLSNKNSFSRLFVRAQAKGNVDTSLCFWLHVTNGTGQARYGL